MRIWGMFSMGMALVLAATEPMAGAPAPVRVTPKTEAPSEARSLSRAFANAARAIGPSVVRIEVTTDDDEATASGIIIDTLGNVVTSNHVLDGAKPTGIAVVLVDGRRFAVDVAGRDSGTDVAVLRIPNPPSDLSAARFGDSDSAVVGEWVLAVGSPLGLEQTITAGIISGRSHLAGQGSGPGQPYLQTDASVNPGNSGGPLVSLDGEVLGLSAMISAGPGGSYAYAIPINRVRRTAQMLIKEGRARHPYIGVALRDLRDLDRAERQRLGKGKLLPVTGALVSRIWRDAPAARAGLRPGDVIVSVNSRQIPTPAELADLIATQEVGARLVLEIVREGSVRSIPLSIEEQPISPGESAPN